MLKIIWDTIKSWLKYQPHEHTLNIAYTNCVYATSRARTLGQLYHAKSLIKMHQQLTNQYDLPILHERQQHLTALWNQRYTLWKNRRG